MCVDELDDNLGSPDSESKVGIDGPKISVSRIPARSPLRAKDNAKFTKLMLVSASGGIQTTNQQW